MLKLEMKALYDLRDKDGQCHPHVIDVVTHGKDHYIKPNGQKRKVLYHVTHLAKEELFSFIANGER